MSDAWSGRIRDSLEYTFEDVLGDRNVSLAEVQAACALVRGAGGREAGTRGWECDGGGGKVCQRGQGGGAWEATWS